MKLPTRTSPRRNRRRASTMLIVMALLGLMIAMITADFLALRDVDRELKLTNKRQTRRLEGQSPAAKPPATNNPATRQE